MSHADTDDSSEDRNVDEQRPCASEEWERRPFGPAFFIRHLAAFARDRCPDPQEHLPTVEIRLADGDVLHVCHIIGFAAQWVALAVFDSEDAGHQPPLMLRMSRCRAVDMTTRLHGGKVVKNKDDTGNQKRLRIPFWFAVCAFLAIAAFYLWTEHRAHLFGALPFLVVLTWLSKEETR